MRAGFYFHIPFCIHRCGYCDFNTYAGKENLIPEYVEALCWEMEMVARSSPEEVECQSEFFGGGTPSLLSVKQYEQLFTTMRRLFSLKKGIEIETTLEANPGTVSGEALKGLREVGFNRISFGVQSADPDELRRLERQHDFYDAIEAVKWARQAGFERVNLDLIYGLPEQTLERWKTTLKRALELDPEHFSMYALTIEPGTPYGRWLAKGLLEITDPDLAAEMVEWGGEMLENHGYEQYEISNWAKPGFQCQHNLQTWRNLPYLGFGAGAHGYAAGTRYHNVLHIRQYLNKIQGKAGEMRFPCSPAMVGSRRVNHKVEMQEAMMLGLRLTREGVSSEVFRSRYGIGMREVFGRELEHLTRLGLVEWVEIEKTRGGRPEEVLRLTRRARLVANQVFLHFV